jgi:hypothetical protein
MIENTSSGACAGAKAEPAAKATPRVALAANVKPALRPTITGKHAGTNGFFSV